MKPAKLAMGWQQQSRERLAAVLVERRCTGGACRWTWWKAGGKAMHRRCMPLDLMVEGARSAALRSVEGTRAAAWRSGQLEASQSACSAGIYQHARANPRQQKFAHFHHFITDSGTDRLKMVDAR